VDAVNPLCEVRNVVEEFDRSGIITGEHALDQHGLATADSTLPAVFDALQLAFLGVNSVIQGDKFVTDFVKQLQFLVSKLFH
jgi:hypothetical protein